MLQTLILFALCLASALGSASSAHATPGTPHGVWSTTYTCNGRTMPLELTINVDPLDQNQRNHPVTAAVAFDFAAEQSNTIKRGAVVLKGAYGPNMKALHIKSIDRFIIRPPELRDPSRYEGHYDSATGAFRLSFTSGECRIGPMKRIDRPVLLPAAWRHVADPEKVVAASQEFGLSLPAPVDMQTCGRGHDCHPYAGSWAGRANCGDTAFLFRFDFAPADSDLKSSSRIVYRSGVTDGATLKSDIHIVDIGTGAVGRLRMTGEGAGSYGGIKLSSPSWLTALPTFKAAAFNAGKQSRTDDWFNGRFDTNQCSGWFKLTRLTRPVNDVVNENAILAEREKFSGDWVGVADCDESMVPAKATVLFANRSGSLDLTVGANSFRHGIVAPQPPITDAMVRSGPLFEATNPAGGKIVFDRPGAATPSYISGRVENLPALAQSAQCRKGAGNLHLVRFAPSPLPQGPYAAMATIEQRCSMLRRWLEPAEAELRVIAELSRDPSLRINPSQLAQGAAVTLFNPAHFNAVFGVPLSEVNDKQIEELVEHTRYCALINDSALTAGVTAGTWPSNDRAAFVARAMNSATPAPWIAVESISKLNVSVARSNADQEEVAATNFQQVIESQFTDPTNTFTNLQQFFEGRHRFAFEIRPSRLQAMIPDFKDKIPKYLRISQRRAEEVRIARAAAAEAEAKARAAAAEAEERRKLEACRAQGPIGSRPPTDAELTQALSNYFLSNCSTPQLAWKVFQNPEQAANSTQWAAMMVLARAEREGSACRISTAMFQGRFGISSASVRGCQKADGGRFQCSALVQMSCSAGAVANYNGPPVAMQANMMCAIATMPSATTVSAQQLSDCTWVVAPMQ